MLGLRSRGAWRAGRAGCRRRPCSRRGPGRWRAAARGRRRRGAGRARRSGSGPSADRAESPVAERGPEPLAAGDRPRAPRRAAGRRRGRAGRAAPPARRGTRRAPPGAGAEAVAVPARSARRRTRHGPETRTGCASRAGAWTCRARARARSRLLRMTRTDAASIGERCSATVSGRSPSSSSRRRTRTGEAQSLAGRSASSSRCDRRSSRSRTAPAAPPATRTVAITGRIARETSMLPMAHLTCVGHTTRGARPRSSGVLTALRRAQHAGAARRPAGRPRRAVDAHRGGVDYAAELVALPQGRRATSPSGSPPSPRGTATAETLDEDAQVLKAKHDAGAEFAVTEMCFRAADYFDLVERCPRRRRRHPDRARDHADPEPRVDAPDGRAVGRARCPTTCSRGSCRCRTTRRRARGGRRRSPPSSARRCSTGGAPGLHFYTLNRSKATREIFSALRLAV